MRRLMALISAGFLVAVLSGCAAGVGAGAAAGAYEYQNKQALEELEERYEAGEITQEEYRERKENIESGSVVY
ncbi:SHOCT domain-containing protein [Thiohalomonas denitrificans]|uniref:Short C-terminal domain-containing protein n=1 Tax=Thiohalomonas denitrificans TaxID=415747 RepID=A0A1G5PQM7_9GAMM|nr:SHOCT domain-containing protein [Thiohalomonas denitrificans]SCZ51884.1 Short C-terminal domain-containing protein [Thiohalomonas denitrificans]